MIKSWHQVTVSQFQRLAIINSKDNPDYAIDVIGVLYDLTNAEIDELPASDFKKMLKASEFINESVLKTMKRGWRNYKFEPNIDKHKNGCARYIEVKHHEKDMIGNLHMLLASMVAPSINVLGYRYKKKYDTTKYQDYANDMLELPIPIAFAWSGFFLTLLERLKSRLKSDLVRETTIEVMREMRVPKQKARMVAMNLAESLDGSIKLN